MVCPVDQDQLHGEMQGRKRRVVVVGCENMYSLSTTTSNQLELKGTCFQNVNTLIMDGKRSRFVPFDFSEET
jgi:hypothetical protein